MEWARSRLVSPTPVSMPSSTSKPARRAAPRAATRAANGWPRRRRAYSSRGVDLLIQGVPVGAATPQVAQRLFRQEPGEIIRGSPTSSATARTSSRRPAYPGSSWICGSSPIVRSMSTTPEAARSRQTATTSAGVLRYRGLAALPARYKQNVQPLRQ